MLITAYPPYLTWGKQCSTHVYLPTVSTYQLLHTLIISSSPLQYSKLFSSITCQTQSYLSGMVMRYLKKVVSATLILASSLSSVMMPVATAGPMMMSAKMTMMKLLPPSSTSSALRRGVLAASPMMSVMTIGKKDYAGW